MGKGNQYWILQSSENSGGRWRESEQAEDLRNAFLASSIPRTGLVISLSGEQ